MSESIRGRLLPTVERRDWVSQHVWEPLVQWELLVQLGLVWVLVFGLLIVLLSCAISPLYGALWIAVDAARGATLVDAAVFVLLKLLPAK